MRRGREGGCGEEQARGRRLLEVPRRRGAGHLGRHALPDVADDGVGRGQPLGDVVEVDAAQENPMQS